MNGPGRRLWWTDRDDPRFAASLGAKLAFLLVWTLGFLLLVGFGQLVLYLLSHLSNVARIGS